VASQQKSAAVAEVPIRTSVALCSREVAVEWMTPAADGAVVLVLMNGERLRFDENSSRVMRLDQSGFASL
jgi:hypothetical protein